MENISHRLIHAAYDRGEKVVLCRRVLSGYFPFPDSHGNTDECWQIETFYHYGLVGRVHVRPNKQYDHSPSVALEASPADVARVALDCHGNDFYSRGVPVTLVIVEDPRIAGVVTVIDPHAQAQPIQPQGHMTASGRDSVLVG